MFDPDDNPGLWDPNIPDDAEHLDMRRQIVLGEIDVLHRQKQRLEREIAQEQQYHREAQAREVWLHNQFIDHVPVDVAQRIRVDLRVNDMDPDFSFVEAIGA